MALSFQYRSRSGASPGLKRVAILPGAWNPPTVAHLAIGQAAKSWASEVVLVLPRNFPHKAFEGAGFNDRIALLRKVSMIEAETSLAVAEGGLYLEMADEAAAFYGPGVEIGLVCGRDAAERIAAWDYGTPGVFDAMIARYPLLVAARAGDYAVPPHHTGRIITLPMEASFSEISSTEVRRRIAAGEPWRHLVPESIAADVKALYGPRQSDM